MMRASDVRWVVTDEKEYIPYIDNSDFTKIKLIESGLELVVDGADGYNNLEYKKLVGQTIGKLFGVNVEDDLTTRDVIHGLSEMESFLIVPRLRSANNLYDAAISRGTVIRIANCYNSKVNKAPWQKRKAAKELAEHDRREAEFDKERDF